MRLIPFLLLAALAGTAQAALIVNQTLCEGNDLFVGVSVDENATICSYYFTTPSGSEFYFYDYKCKNYTVTWPQMLVWTAAPIGPWRVRLVHQLGGSVYEENLTATMIAPFDGTGTLSVPNLVTSGSEIALNATWNEKCPTDDNFTFVIDGGGKRIPLYEGRVRTRNVSTSVKSTAPRTAGNYIYTLKYRRALTGTENNIATKTLTVAGVNVIFENVSIYSIGSRAVFSFFNSGTSAALMSLLKVSINSTFGALNKMQSSEAQLPPGQTNITLVWDDDFQLIGFLPGTFYIGELQMKYKDTFLGGELLLNQSFNGTVLSVCGNSLCEYKECTVCPADCSAEDCLGDGICAPGFGENCLNDCPCKEGICNPASPKAGAYGCTQDEVDIEVKVTGDGSPLLGASVRLGNFTCTTDPAGSCSFTVLRGAYDLFVEKEGYFNHSSVAAASTSISLEKIPPPSAFDPAKFFAEHKTTFALMVPLLPLFFVLFIFLTKKLRG